MTLKNFIKATMVLTLTSALLTSCNDYCERDLSDPREHYFPEYYFTFDEIPEGITITDMVGTESVDTCYSFEVHDFRKPVDIRIVRRNPLGHKKPQIANLEVTALKVFHGRSCITHDWTNDLDYLSPSKDGNGVYEFDNGVKVAFTEKNGEPYLRLMIPEDCKIIDNREECEIIIGEVESINNGPKLGGDLRFTVVPENPETAKIKINYKGKTYESSFIPSDSPVYLDKETAELVKSFEGRVDLTSVYVGGILYIYDENDIRSKPALKKITEKPAESREIQLSSFTRAIGDELNDMQSGALGFCALFNNHSFAGKNIYKNLFHFKEYYDENKMDDVELGDKVSSLVVTYNGSDPEVCAVLTVWEDSDFNYGDNDRTKHRMSFIATKDHPVSSCAYLTAIQCIGSSNSWNDRISSISFYFGNFGSYWKNY